MSSKNASESKNSINPKVKLEEVLKSKTPTKNKSNANLNEYSQYNNELAKFLQYLNGDKRNKEDIKKYIKSNLLSFYNNKKVRHSYASISGTLQTMRSSEAAETSILMYNLDVLLNEVIPDSELAHVSDKIYKFYDHCQLELSRFNYFDSIFWRSDSAQKDYDRLQSNLSDSKEKIDILNKQIDGAKIENITILSIFAAIALAAIGGLSFTGNILKQINEASIYRLIMVISMTGFVLFNTLFMLIYMISRIIGKSIYTICPETGAIADCRYKQRPCKNDCWGINRVRKRLPYIFWTNLVLLLLMFFDFAVWAIRNKLLCVMPNVTSNN